MPQIFHPSTNTLSKVSIFGAVFFVGGAVLALAAFFRSSYVSRVGVSIEQPVEFSHEHHVTGLGIDCRYCHSSVEEGPYAGMPATHTCMSCHSQIWTNADALAPVRESFQSGQPIPWVRVYDLPDYTYFNHSIHVNKGIGCESCHGDVAAMPLTYKANTLYMEWCLECHRHPERFVRPREEVFTLNYQPEEDQQIIGARLVEEYDIRPGSVLDDCYICHR